MRTAKAGILLLVAVWLTGCGAREIEEEQSHTVVVGFSEVGAESDWRVANTESMRNTFTENKGYELLFDDAKQKQDNQIAAIRNYILQGVDYIVVAPVIETGWDEVLTEAKDAKIPVIVVDRMIHTEDENLYTAWVGSDFYREGQVAMEWLDQYLTEQKRNEETISILHVMGTEGATSQIGRTTGLLQGLEEHANWELAEVLPGEYTQAKTYEVVSEYLKKNKDIDVIYCENDNSAFGAIQAMDEAGISYGDGGDVIVISFDATEAGLNATLAGKINLDVECNPLHGPRVEGIIDQLQEGKSPDKLSYVEETYFTRADLSEELISERQY